MLHFNHVFVVFGCYLLEACCFLIRDRKRVDPEVRWGVTIRDKGVVRREGRDCQGQRRRKGQHQTHDFSDMLQVASSISSIWLSKGNSCKAFQEGTRDLNSGFHVHEANSPTKLSLCLLAIFLN